MLLIRFLGFDTFEEDDDDDAMDSLNSDSFSVSLSSESLASENIDSCLGLHKTDHIGKKHLT